MVYSDQTEREMRRRPPTTLLLFFLSLLPGTLNVTALQLGSRAADEWIELLEREERLRNLKVDEVLSRIGVTTGMVVADIGAGTGVFSRPLAVAVGQEGRLLAADVDQELLDHISERARAAELSNITTVLSEFNDAKLPQLVDIAFFHDVLHHIENRQLYISNLKPYLKPGARIVIIDPRAGHPDAPHSDSKEMNYSTDDLKAWMGAIGFETAADFDLWESKFFLVFERRE